MGSVPFTQYLFPNGRTRPLIVTTSDSISEKAKSIIAKGYQFEAEIVPSNLVSLTIFNTKTEEDEYIEICSNGPSVIKAVDKLVLDAYKGIKP